MLADRHGPVAVYGVPYLRAGTPSAANCRPSPGAKTPRPAPRPAGTRACSGARSGASAPTPARGAVSARWRWRTPGSPGERPAIRSGTSPSAASAGSRPPCSTASSYVALGHLHGQQTLGHHLRYSGSPLPYSFSEARHAQGIVAGRAGRRRRRPGRADTRPGLPRPERPARNAHRPADVRRLRAIRGRLPVRGADRHGPAGGCDGEAACAGSRTCWCWPSSPRAPPPTPAATARGSPAATT